MKPFFVFLLCLALLPGLARAACTPTELKALLTADAAGLGFAPLISARRDADIVLMANQPRTGAPYQINRGSITGAEILANADKDEFLALTQAKHLALQTVVVLGLGKVDISKTSVRGILAEIFPAAGPTRAALAAYVNRDGSWAEVHCGRNVTTDHVTAALNLP